MGSKRRDLKRRGRKNMKKYTENTGSLSEEVFADGLKSPNCAIILVHCLLSIENQVMELFALHEQTKYTQIKQQESLDLLSNKFDELEREHKKKKRKNNRVWGKDRVLVKELFKFAPGQGKHKWKYLGYSSQAVFCNKGVLKNYTKFVENNLCKSLQKNRLRHRCFSVNYVKSLKTLSL